MLARLARLSVEYRASYGDAVCYPWLFKFTLVKIKKNYSCPSHISVVQSSHGAEVAVFDGPGRERCRHYRKVYWTALLCSFNIGGCWAGGVGTAKNMLNKELLHQR